MEQRAAKVGSERYSLQPEEQRLESSDHPGAAHLWWPSVVQVHHLERLHSQSKPLRYAYLNQLVWRHRQLPDRQQLLQDALLRTHRQIYLLRLVGGRSKGQGTPFLGVPFITGRRHLGVAGAHPRT